MKANLVDRTLFPKAAWVLLLLIPVTFLGFYPSYFSRFTAPMPSVIHVHGVLMLTWLAMAVLQPLLMYYKKIRVHRSAGRISYIIMPTVIISGYFILKHSYQRALNGDAVGLPGYYPEDLPLHIKAAEFVVIGSVYWVWLTLYYILGVVFRKNLVAHASFMLAAALTILGPAGDRFIGHICDALGLPYNAVAENFVFGLVSVIFVSLGALHFKRNLSLKPTMTVLALHSTGVFLFHTMPYHPTWNWLTSLLF